MKDNRKAVAFGWFAAAVMPLGLVASLCFGAPPSSAAPGRGLGTGGKVNQPDLSAPGPLFEKMSFPASGPTTVKGSDWIPIDAAKRYTVTGWFKSVGRQPSNIYFGFACFDAEKKAIGPENVGVVGATETTLYEACKKEDTTVKVVHAFKWKENAHGCIAFEVDDTGKYSDLPNRNLSGFGITKLDEKQGYWEVHLNEPCGQAHPAGTKVREHSSGPAHLYSAAAAQLVPTDWTQYSGSVMGYSDAGTGTAHWWHGTRYVKMIMLLNYDQDQGSTVMVGGLGITAEAPAELPSR